MKVCLVSRSIRLTAGGLERRMGTSASSLKTTWWSCTLCSNTLRKFLCSNPESSEDFHFLPAFSSEYYRMITIASEVKQNGIVQLRLASSCVIFRLLAINGSPAWKDKQDWSTGSIVLFCSVCIICKDVTFLLNASCPYYFFFLTLLCRN